MSLRLRSCRAATTGTQFCARLEASAEDELPGRGRSIRRWELGSQGPPRLGLGAPGLPAGTRRCSRGVCPRVRRARGPCDAPCGPSRASCRCDPRAPGAVLATPGSLLRPDARLSLGGRARPACKPLRHPGRRGAASRQAQLSRALRRRPSRPSAGLGVVLARNAGSAGGPPSLPLPLPLPLVAGRPAGCGRRGRRAPPLGGPSRGPGLGHPALAAVHPLPWPRPSGSRRGVSGEPSPSLHGASLRVTHPTHPEPSNGPGTYCSVRFIILLWGHSFLH